MSSVGSVSRLILAAKEGDAPSLELLFKRYWEKVVLWARKGLDESKCREFDADDVAIDVFQSFYEGFKGGNYPNLDSRDGLNALLATIAIKKAINRIEKANAQKRGGGQIRGESALVNQSNAAGIQNANIPSIAKAITPDEKTILDDAIDYRLNSLQPPQLQLIAQRLIVGFSTAEIAKELNLTQRSIQLKIKAIARIWQEDETLTP